MKKLFTPLILLISANLAFSQGIFTSPPKTSTFYRVEGDIAKRFCTNPNTIHIIDYHGISNRKHEPIYVLSDKLIAALDPTASSTVPNNFLGWGPCPKTYDLNIHGDCLNLEGILRLSKDRDTLEVFSPSKIKYLKIGDEVYEIKNNISLQKVSRFTAPFKRVDDLNRGIDTTWIWPKNRFQSYDTLEAFKNFFSSKLVRDHEDSTHWNLQCHVSDTIPMLRAYGKFSDTAIIGLKGISRSLGFWDSLIQTKPEAVKKIKPKPKKKKPALRVTAEDTASMLAHWLPVVHPNNTIRTIKISKHEKSKIIPSSKSAYYRQPRILTKGIL